jgi:hypothetical protein
MSITFPTDTEQIIDEIRTAIGRDVIFYRLYSTDCPTCSLDPISDTSTDSFCPTCSGLYYITTPSGTTVNGHVTWGNMDEMQWPTGGQYFKGDCRLQIKYTLNSLSMVNNTDYIVADSKKFIIDKFALRGVPELNRIVIILNEEDRNG